MSTSTHTSISLHRFVDELTTGLLPLAVSRATIIVNQIDRSLELGTDENMLAYVLWNLLDRAVCSTRNECIHVESVRNAENTTIVVRNAGTYFYRTLSSGFRQVQHAAEKLGGSISIDTEENCTTVALTLHKDLATA
jgi:hypothetical protein